MPCVRTIFSVTFLMVQGLAICQSNNTETIYHLKHTDTLTIELSYIGCSGGIRYKYVFYKSQTHIAAVCYKPEPTGMQSPGWHTDTIIQLSDPQLKAVAGYELALLNYKPSPNTNAITGGGIFKIYLNSKYHIEKEINGFDSFGFRDTIKALSRRKDTGETHNK